MKTELFCIYDAKAKFYNKPFNFPNTQTAMRMFTDLANDPNSEICKHPEDYTMFHLGSYDDEQAKITVNKIPEPICSALSVHQPDIPFPSESFEKTTEATNNVAQPQKA